jgi:hypothetical protein
MRIKKKLAVVAFVVAVFVGATAPVSADVLCETEATSFNHWFYKKFYCR